MVKANVFVVKDSWGGIVEVTFDKKKAIEIAIEEGSLDSFSDFADKWMRDHDGEDLLDLLEEHEPKVLLRDEYFDTIEDDLDKEELEGIEKFEVEIPFDVIEASKPIPPEVLAVIVNIFNS